MRAVQADRLRLPALQWMDEVLSTRTAETTIKQTIKTRTSRGRPQGGVRSPLMWSLVVDALLNRLTAFGGHCTGYADAIVIIAKRKYEEILCELIQTTLRSQVNGRQQL